MKFECSAQELLSGLVNATRALSSRPAMQILEGVMMHAEDDELELMCSDGIKNILAKDKALAEKILAAADESGAKIIGLSALMTTTMQEMDGVIQLARKQGRGDLHFIVGGAVLTDDYARSIGAKYAPDAMATVHIAKKLTENDKKA